MKKKPLQLSAGTLQRWFKRLDMCIQRNTSMRKKEHCGTISMLFFC